MVRVLTEFFLVLATWVMKWFKNRDREDYFYRRLQLSKNVSLLIDIMEESPDEEFTTETLATLWQARLGTDEEGHSSTAVFYIVRDLSNEEHPLVDRIPKPGDDLWKLNEQYNTYRPIRETDDTA